MMATFFGGGGELNGQQEFSGADRCLSIITQKQEEKYTCPGLWNTFFPQKAKLLSKLLKQAKYLSASMNFGI